MDDAALATTVDRAKALLDLVLTVRRRTVNGALVVEEGPIGVLASSCAAILGMGFDIVDGFAPFRPDEVRRNAAILIAMFPRDPSRDEIRSLALAAMRHAPGSILVVRARGRDARDFAFEMRDAHEEFLVETADG